MSRSKYTLLFLISFILVIFGNNSISPKLNVIYGESSKLPWTVLTNRDILSRYKGRIQNKYKLLELDHIKLITLKRSLNSSLSHILRENHQLSRTMSFKSSSNPVSKSMSSLISEIHELCAEVFDISCKEDISFAIRMTKFSYFA